MPSRARLLPNIPIKHTTVRKVITLTPSVEATLRAYIAYHIQQQGLDAAQAPSEADTIVAIAEDFLARDRGFRRVLHDKEKEKNDMARI